MLIRERHMTKIKWFANEYRYVITAIGIILILLVNVATAAYVIGKVSMSMSDIREERVNQNAINKEFSANLSNITTTVTKLKEQVDDLYTEHIELMNLHKLSPYKWGTIKPRRQ